MRAASILPALVVVLGFVSAAGATTINPTHDFTITVCGGMFGFQDDQWPSRPDMDSSTVFLGPFGMHEVPFTATQGLIGFGLILALLVVFPMAVLTVRWKKKRL